MIGRAVNQMQNCTLGRLRRVKSATPAYWPAGALGAMDTELAEWSMTTAKPRKGVYIARERGSWCDYWYMGVCEKQGAPIVWRNPMKWPHGSEAGDKYAFVCAVESALKKLKRRKR